MPLAFTPALTFGRALRGIAIAGAALALASCAQQTSQYGQLGDVKPHPGVAKAHRMPIQGIDVSRWQGKIDWASVAASGKQFAFIKATEGGDHIDPRFIENWYGAKQAGLARGAYHFMFWCRPAEDQARWFKQNVPNDPDALPPVLDVEWNNHSKTCPQKISKERALAMIRHMLHEMERYTGKRPIIYTDINFHEDILEGELLDYPHWIRSTAAEPHHRYRDRKWTLWQFTTTGRVPGIKGDVDRNAFYGSEKEWRAFLQNDCDPRHTCPTTRYASN
ncbi:glycoside hydrolase family 25 protein [Enterovirga aerilata]|uniref:Glycoside hydrolase family 25 protein n=1 Tax=Enterovirga aerilata TaxID=2730920 RepID=A0A849I6H2_9HYPH|nr:GH25 family lysozyme [Enterovirga sp. DB1703]NNM72911.1 glycoside hydrolase family 25 protein [Enterovirga sp. DB1703]